MNSPCFGCKERKSLCHSVCVKYKVFAEQRACENHTRTREIKASNDVMASKKAYKR